MLVKEAHKKSSYHRDEMDKSELCACFYCLHRFHPNTVEEWINSNQTALCPVCRIDSVLPEKAGYPLTRKFLKEMHHYWFKTGKTLRFKNGKQIHRKQKKD